MSDVLRVTMGMPTYCNSQALVDMTLNAVDSFVATLGEWAADRRVVLDGVWVFENAPENDFQEKLVEGCEARPGVSYAYWSEPFNMNRIYNAVVDRGADADVVVCANNDVVYHEGWLEAAAKYLRLAPNGPSPYVMVEPIHLKRDDDFVETHPKLPDKYRVKMTLNSAAGYCLILAGWYARQRPFNPEVAFGGQEHVHRAEIESDGYLSGLVSSCWIEHLGEATKKLAPDRVGELRAEAAAYWRKYGKSIGSW